MNGLSTFVSRVLWNSRLLIGVAILASLVISIVMLWVTSLDAWNVIMHIASYDPESTKRHIALIGHVAGILDGYLFAAILIIFALGLYELFIGKLHITSDATLASNILIIQSVDDLKQRLANVVFLILIVRYFQFALEQEVKSPLDLLFLAIGITLIALALFLTTHVEPKAKKDQPRI